MVFRFSYSFLIPYRLWKLQHLNMILISCCFLEGKKLYNVFLFITCHVIIGDLKSIRSIIISEWESKLYLATTKPKKKWKWLDPNSKPMLRGPKQPACARGQFRLPPVVAFCVGSEKKRRGARKVACKLSDQDLINTLTTRHTSSSQP